MYLDKNSEKKWLIKSENRILGPYSFDQIIDLIRKKQISIIDEIRDPETRWLYIRENKDFKNVVEEIRKEQDSKQESTKTFQSTTANTAVTSTAATVTTTNTGAGVSSNSTANGMSGNTVKTTFEDVLQKTQANFSTNEDTVTNFQAKDVEIVKEVVDARVETTPSVKIEKAKMYGVQTDAAVQEKVSTFAFNLKMALAAVSLLIAGGFVSYVYINKQSVQKREQDMLVKLRDYKASGLKQKVAETYIDLPLEVKKTIFPQLLDIFPVLQKNAAARIEDIKELRNNSSGLTPDQRAYVELILYWLAAKEQNYGLANDHLNLAKQRSPSLKLIDENEAWLMLKKNQAQESYKEFKSIKDSNGRILFGRVAAFIKLSELEQSKIAAELLSDIEKYTLFNYNFRKELLLAQIYLSKLLDRDSFYNEALKSYFNTYPQLTELFINPSLLFPSAFEWSELERLRDAVYSKLSGDEAILFQFHNLLEQNQLSMAAEFIKAESPRISDSQIKAQMNILLLHMQGRHKEVADLGQINTHDRKSTLNALVIGLSVLKVDPKRNVNDFLNVLSTDETKFYKSWLELESLVGKGKFPEVKNHIMNQMETVRDFIPVAEANILSN